MKEIVFDKTFRHKSGRYIQFHKHSKHGLGRFGGGWNWKFGFQLGSESIIFNLFVMFIRIRFKSFKPKPYC